MNTNLLLHLGPPNKFGLSPEQMEAAHGLRGLVKDKNGEIIIHDAALERRYYWLINYFFVNVKKIECKYTINHEGKIEW